MRPGLFPLRRRRSRSEAMAAEILRGKYEDERIPPPATCRLAARGLPHGECLVSPIIRTNTYWLHFQIKSTPELGSSSTRNNLSVRTSAVVPEEAGDGTTEVHGQSGDCFDNMESFGHTPARLNRDPQRLSKTGNCETRKTTR